MPGTTVAKTSSLLRRALLSDGRPWILALGEVAGMTPLRLGIVAAIVLTPPSYVFGHPLMTPILTAYALAITSYLIHRQIRELDGLEPLITYDQATLDRIRHGLRYHPRWLLWSGWIIGPVAMVLVNFTGPQISAIRAGEFLTPGAAWGLFLAALFWVIVFQMLALFFRNAKAFHLLGIHGVRIDLLDVGSLTPFARVAIRNLLIFIGGFAVAPLALLQGNQFLVPLTIGLALTMPCCVALVGIPVYAVHLRLAKAKEEELDRVRRAIRGEREAMEDSPVAEDAGQMTVAGLVMYRRMVEDIQEWPIAASEILRFALYVIIPFLAWVGAALVERAVDAILSMRLPVA
ncbi:MAG: hypothetical protein ABIF09_13425 [Gemmatimonadota bacterium]